MLGRLFLPVILGAVATAQTAIAHPHVWIQAKAELVFDAQNRFTAVRHVWEFDEGFSSFATQGLDENGDGVFTREELAELAQVNMDSLKDFEFFTYVQMGEDDPKYGAPRDYWLKYENSLLTLHFTLPMEVAVSADLKKGFSDLTVEIFDPTFFVDVGFVETEAAKVAYDNGGSGCIAALQRRKELDVIQSKLLAEVGPEEDIPEALLPQEGDLSNTIRVNCEAS